MTGHVFLSYSHDEAARYVERLAQHLLDAGIQVWYDKEIITGHRWAHVIRDQIDSCSAFIVVMTPRAEQSDWVNREIDQAQMMKRPILPLLLGGSRFFTLANLQYEDVTDAAMPGAAFVTRLRQLLPAPLAAPAEPESPTQPEAPTRLEAPTAPATTPAAQTSLAAPASSADPATVPLPAAARTTGRPPSRFGLPKVPQPQQPAKAEPPARTEPPVQAEPRTREVTEAERVGEAGDPAKAVRLLKLMVSKPLASKNPDYLHWRQLIARYQGMLGRHMEARRELQLVLPGLARAGGANHPDTLHCRQQIAHHTGALNRKADAHRAFQQLVADFTRVFGPDHPETLRARLQVAFYTAATGNNAKAIELSKQVLADLVRVLGADAVDTLRARQQVIVLTAAGGDRARALPELRQLAADFVRVAGADHPDTLAARHAVARLTGEAGDSAKARQLFEEVTADRIRVLGRDHIDTRTSAAGILRYGGTLKPAERSWATRDFAGAFSVLLVFIAPLCACSGFLFNLDTWWAITLAVILGVVGLLMFFVVFDSFRRVPRDPRGYELKP